ADAPQGAPPQAAARSHARRGQGRLGGQLRRLRRAGPRARLGLGPPDRGRPHRHDPAHQAWRQGVDPDLPGPAGHQEAGRDPHGLGQGQPGAVDCRGQAGAHHVRAALPQRGDRPRGHRAGHPEAADQGPLRHACHDRGGGDL
ncbi:MAG: LSU ribosomal protein L16p (L10e), partial [uncultured Acidimicrobiales bacterium]